MVVVYGRMETGNHVVLTMTLKQFVNTLGLNNRKQRLLGWRPRYQSVTEYKNPTVGFALVKTLQPFADVASVIEYLVSAITTRSGRIVATLQPIFVYRAINLRFRFQFP